jgi:hypothetical protein
MRADPSRAGARITRSQAHRESLLPKNPKVNPHLQWVVEMSEKISEKHDKRG